MTYWNGNLCNTAVDIVLDSLLFAAILIAYLLQIQRIVNQNSVHGLSPEFLLFNAISSTAQLSEAILFHAFGYPNDRRPVLQLIGDHELKGWAALGGLLGLLQIALQWACSMSLVLVFSSHSSTSNTSKRGGIAGIALAHAAMFLLPAASVSLPTPKPRNMGSGILIGLLNMANTLVAPFFGILQFYPQCLEMLRSRRDPGALSLSSLVLQALVLTAVVVRWFFRLGTPDWGNQRVPPRMWYVWGMIPFNYIVYVIGYAMLLVGYSLGFRGRGYRSMADGQLSLLT